MNTTQYDDNIFYIKQVINNIQMTQNLTLSEALCTEKISTDILFIHKAISKLYEMLQKNSKLITRNDHFHDLLKAELQFHKLLEEESPFVRIHDKNSLLTLHKEIAENIESILGKSSNSFIKQDITTNEELNFLLSE